MKVICPSSGCQQVFDVDTEEDLDRRLNCPECGAVLTVDRDGLRILEPATPRPTSPPKKEAHRMSRSDEPVSPRPASGAALGYQMTHQTLVRKIVGAVILCGIVLYTMASYLGGINFLFRAVFAG
jgi:hypothetical protein